jgi:hypothetical protein
MSCLKNNTTTKTNKQNTKDSELTLVAEHLSSINKATVFHPQHLKTNRKMCFLLKYTFCFKCTLFPKWSKTKPFFPSSGESVLQTAAHPFFVLCMYSHYPSTCTSLLYTELYFLLKARVSSFLFWVMVFAFSKFVSTLMVSIIHLVHMLHISLFICLTYSNQISSFLRAETICSHNTFIVSHIECIFLYSFIKYLEYCPFVALF